MALLQVNDIHTYYGAIQALHGVSLYVDEGEIVSLIGANGAGKSTMLNTICGILRPRKGSILLEGDEIQVTSQELTQIYVACYDRLDEDFMDDEASYGDYRYDLSRDYECIGSIL